MKRRTLLVVLVSLVVLALAYAATGLYQVLPGEAAVVRRFGRVLPERPEPGLHLGLPWGMDRVDRVAVDQLGAWWSATRRRAATPPCRPASC